MGVKMRERTREIKKTTRTVVIIAARLPIKRDHYKQCNPAVQIFCRRVIWTRGFPAPNYLRCGDENINSFDLFLYNNFLKKSRCILKKQKCK
jgi:hypothetical protein